MTALAEWANFYVIIGSSAGALIGLQFVVITLIADAPSPFPSRWSGVAAALHWHSQCLGHRHVSRLCEETGTTRG
jgi:hypothetical protein